MRSLRLLFNCVCVAPACSGAYHGLLSVWTGSVVAASVQREGPPELRAMREHAQRFGKLAHLMIWTLNLG